MSGSWGLALKNILMPQFCKQCGVRILTEENVHFCPDCWERSPRIERPFCPACGKPHPPGAGLMTTRLFECEDCATAKEKRWYRRTWGAAVYEGVRAEERAGRPLPPRDAVGHAVRLLKFHGKTNLVPPLVGVLRDLVERELEPETYDVLVPVPLHRVRERERGFNQSRLLAEAVADVFPNARLDTAFRRVRPTRAQSTLRDAVERRANVRGAFAVTDEAVFANATVLLVDDVITTHGTVNECARVLRKAGAEAVDVLAVALAVRQPVWG
jgi:ComF family protein